MSKQDKEKILEKQDYDVEDGFGSARDLYEKAKKIDVGITLAFVSSWLKSQPNKQTRSYL